MSDGIWVECVASAMLHVLAIAMVDAVLQVAWNSPCEVHISRQ